MDQDMPPVTAMKAQVLKREEAEAILQRIALEAAQGAAQINAACIAFNRIMSMQDVVSTASLCRHTSRRFPRHAMPWFTPSSHLRKHSTNWG